MSTLTILRMIGSAGTGLGLLWVTISLARITRAYPPPPPFSYARIVLSILPYSVMMLCGTIRLLINQDSKVLTGLVIIALMWSTISSWSAAIAIHRQVDALIQTNRDLAKLSKVVDIVKREAEAEGNIESENGNNSNSSNSNGNRDKVPSP